MTKFVKTPHLPKGKVGLAAVGERYRAKLGEALAALGVQTLWLPDAPGADRRLAGHADLSMMHLGGARVVSACGGEADASLKALGFDLISAPGPGGAYPLDCALNACIVGTRLFHRLDITARQVTDNLNSVEPVNIAQGYAKCCTCVVDENSIVTSDKGIARAASAHGLDVLEITPGFVELEGFDYGFIGGSAFKLSESELAFTGRLDGHPDYNRITAFLRKKGISPVFLTDSPAFDVGSVLPLTES